MSAATTSHIPRNDDNITLSEARPAITPKDLYEVPRLAVQGVIAWTLPEAAWWPLSRLFGQINAATHPLRTRRETEDIAGVLTGTRASGKIARIAAENWANRYEERFHYLRAWRPGGWKPELKIVGGENVSTALTERRGILFWAGNFSFNDLVTKMAWRQLGLSVMHFSRPIHGFSTTKFGIRYLNAVRRRIEDRYLGERIMAEVEQTRIATQRMGERLAANGFISFTVGNRGQRTATAKFLGGRITLATGPLALARRTGASVLPVYTLRLAPTSFEITFGKSLNVPEDAAGNPDYAAAVQTYAESLAEFVLRDPGQWRGWRYTSIPKD
jgi:lauroyl/myristoyl acyltransferase